MRLMLFWRLASASNGRNQKTYGHENAKTYGVMGTYVHLTVQPNGVAREDKLKLTALALIEALRENKWRQRGYWRIDNVPQPTRYNPTNDFKLLGTGTNSVSVFMPYGDEYLPIEVKGKGGKLTGEYHSVTRDRYRVILAELAQAEQICNRCQRDLNYQIEKHHSGCTLSDLLTVPIEVADKKKKYFKYGGYVFSPGSLSLNMQRGYTEKHGRLALKLARAII